MAMPPEKLPSIDYLLMHYKYDQDTGILSLNRQVKTEGRVSKQLGKVCVSPQNRGYYRIGMQNKRYLVHRICWKMHYGEEPLGQIDHINMDKTDNRIINLRVVTNAENHTNMGQKWPYIISKGNKFACRTPRCFSHTQPQYPCVSPNHGYLVLLKKLPSAKTAEQNSILTLIKKNLLESIPR
jgi:hypothetical protein